MPIFYIAEFHEGLFETPHKVEPEKTNGWRFFAYCAEDDITSCSLLFKDFPNFTKGTQEAFADLWNYVWEAGKSGTSWALIFQNGKQFHPIHKFEVLRKDTKRGKRKPHPCEIHQFKRKKTDIRVLFVYTDKKLIAFVTHAFEKDKQETPQKEKSRAETLAQEFFDAIDNQTIQIITAQGGKNETRKIFYD